MRVTQTAASPVVRRQPSKGYQEAMRRKQVRTTTWRTLVTIIVVLGALIILAPVLWMLSTSVKSLPDTQAFPPQWIPQTLHWDNFVSSLTFLPFGTFALNTVIVTAACLVGDVLVNSFIAYAFAKIQAPGRNVLFLFVLSTLMIPFPVLMIPQFLLFKTFGWIDTLLPLIVPSFFGNAFYIFMFRQFYLTIPRELSDAARIDGCSHFGIYWRIMLPLIRPALATVAIFSFTFNWNDYLSPLIYLDSQEHYTLTLGLASFIGRYGAQPWNLLMAASLVTVLPCVILYFFAQKYFIQGIVVSGVKG
ncbi:sugar ABC transporter permease [Dictyobacter sp. S3.2.2.5]|uniref:Sugar ABC transporter permease n=1 Tax=Dictyobacter halimunensis TaxID=3026934 RepID=A0ABQ6FP72_9CHLR|nr:sugar ABC transporter permease [Dictyobacter sp. S3.2.2.5]